MAARQTRRSIAHRVASPSTRERTLRSSRLSTSSRPSTSTASTSEQNAEPGLYDQLMALEQQEGVIRNIDLVFCQRCDVCVDEFEAIAIRDCLHHICITCIRLCIQESGSIEVKCPVATCECNLQDREIRSLLTQIEYAKHMQKVFEENTNANGGHLYDELKNLDEQMSVIKCIDKFECEICMMDTEPYDGMMLRDCLHRFCIDCVRGTVNSSNDARIKCPANECEEYLSDREIRSLLTQAEFDKYMEKTLRIAESTMAGSYHCKKPNCNGWCIVEDIVNTFQCPCCGSNNCLSCQAIHKGMNCKQYQQEIRFRGLGDDERTQMVMNEIIEKGEGMKCSKCQVLIMKRVGCDFLICSMCKTELCWATKGPRWGPAGFGDLSGGCRCMPTKRCHPKCQNCH